MGTGTTEQQVTVIYVSELVKDFGPEHQCDRGCAEIAPIVIERFRRYLFFAARDRGIDVNDQKRRESIRVDLVFDQPHWVSFVPTLLLLMGVTLRGEGWKGIRICRPIQGSRTGRCKVLDIEPFIAACVGLFQTLQTATSTCEQAALVTLGDPEPDALTIEAASPVAVGAAS